MSNNQKKQKYSRPTCKGKMIEKEVYHDISPVDTFIQTSSSIKVCDNENCGIGKSKLEEYDY
jgi:hypothetical protein